MLYTSYCFPPSSLFGSGKCNIYPAAWRQMDGIFLDFYNHSEEWTARNTEVKLHAYTSLISKLLKVRDHHHFSSHGIGIKNETKKERGKKEKKKKWIVPTMIPIL